MVPFLRKVAEELLQNHTSFDGVGIILPSRRAGVFLKREISALLSKPLLAPTITTTEDFLLENLGWEQENMIQLIFKLYRSYEKLNLEDKDSFIEFSKWAQTLIGDFNEIDRYLIDANSLFDYISDAKRIESWDLGPGESSDTQMVNDYLLFWELLPQLYSDFSSKLKQEKRVYQGLAYRQLAENMEDYLPAIKKKYSKLYFVGFSALNEAEERILMRLHEEKIAHFFWDFDSYYYEDSVHEAGKFLRDSKIIKRLKDQSQFKKPDSFLSQLHKKIKIKSVSGDTLQAITGNASVLEYQNDQLEEVAVVMADENLLLPFLNNLAADIPAVNVTMGLPLRFSPIAGFFNLLWEMHVWQETSGNTDKEGNPAFHYQKWDDVLGHPVSKKWDKEGTIEKLRSEIRKQNQVFVSLPQLKSWLSFNWDDEVESLFTKDSAEPQNWCASLGRFTEYAKPFYDGGVTETGILYGFFQLFAQLERWIKESNLELDVKTSYQFYKELLQTETIDLKGEPLKGLQVMGMLETRTLDFKNVILTSVNEDVLPKGRVQNSMIPFDIKHRFGLPTYLDKDGVFAYHFFRLLQRAENITILYNNQNQGLGGGEPSRFIAQIEHELCRVNPDIDFSKETISSRLIPQEEEAKEVVKTPSILKRLDELAERGISPSALIDYINDPLLFYYRRILGLQETDEVEEVIGYHTQGTIIHEILQDYYSVEEDSGKGPLKRLHADLPVFQKTESELRDEVIKKLQNAGLKDVSHGKNLLIRETLTGMLRNFLAKEKEQLKDKGEVEILSLETGLSQTLKLANGKQVLIKGLADRIDRLGEHTRIIDYKTGGVNQAEVRFKDLDELKQPNEKNKSFQLLAYSFLYANDQLEMERVFPSIISLRNVNNWPIELKWGKEEGVTQEDLKAFKGFLVEILEEIFDPEIPFSEKMLSLSKHENQINHIDP
jgi:hypothetical protein